jgi:sulfate permease, SulP family
VRVPVIPPTFRGYRKSWLGPDVLAGLTLVAIAIPEQMATAHLAGMPAVAGLYAFVAGSVMFALLGRSGQMSVGADSTTAPVIAAGVAAVVVAGTPEYTHLVSLLALVVGGLLIVVGLLRLGWISDFFSTPVITGVLAGIAVEILVRQVPVVLGLVGGGTTTIGRVRTVVDQIGHTNGWAVGIAVVVLAVIVVAEKVDRRIPGALIGLVASILVVAGTDLKARGVPVLGSIHGGLPSFAIPTASWADIRGLAAPALTITFLCVAQTAATVRASSAGAPATQDFNQDLMAIGAGSLVAGVSGAFPVNSSPPRTAVVTTAGGRSQLTSVVAAAVVLGVVLLATGLLTDLPKATLGAILIFVATRLFRVRVLRSIAGYDRLEFAVAAVTLLTVALLGIEQGAVLAMGVSLADRVRRNARPRDAVLGREVGTDHWIPTDIGRPTEQVPGVVVYLVYAPVWYGNADYVRLRVRTILEQTQPKVRALVLDADAISDIDFTGAAALGALTTELKQQGVTLGIARSSHLVHHDLKHSGLLQDIGPHLFSTVEDAVAAFTGTS